MRQLLVHERNSRLVVEPVYDGIQMIGMGGQLRSKILNGAIEFIRPPATDIFFYQQASRQGSKAETCRL